MNAATFMWWVDMFLRNRKTVWVIGSSVLVLFCGFDVCAGVHEKDRASTWSVFSGCSLALCTQTCLLCTPTLSFGERFCGSFTITNGRLERGRSTTLRLRHVPSPTCVQRALPSFPRSDVEEHVVQQRVRGPTLCLTWCCFAATSSFGLSGEKVKQVSLCPNRRSSQRPLPDGRDLQSGLCLSAGMCHLRRLALPLHLWVVEKSDPLAERSAPRATASPWGPRSSRSPRVNSSQRRAHPNLVKKRSKRANATNNDQTLPRTRAIKNGQKTITKNPSRLEGHQKRANTIQKNAVFLPWPNRRAIASHQTAPLRPTTRLAAALGGTRPLTHQRRWTSGK